MSDNRRDLGGQEEEEEEEDMDDMVEIDTDAGPPEEDEEEGDGAGEGDSAMSHDGDEGEGAEDAAVQDDAAHVFSGHTDSVYAVACSPSDTLRVASGGGDEVTFLWSVGGTEDPTPLRGHSDSVSALAFSSDGALLASGGLDGVVCLWDAATQEQKAKLEGPSGGIEWCCWHPRGPVVLAGAEDFTAWMWNAPTAACMAVFTGHSGPVTCGTFSPDGKSVLTGSEDASVRIWDPRSGAALATLSGHTFHSGAVNSLDVRAEGAVGVAGSADHTGTVFSLQTGKVAGKLVGHEDSVECIRLHSSLPIVASGGLDRRLLIWDLNSIQIRSTCEHQEGVVQVAWHPTQPSLVVTGSADGSVQVWDGRSAESVRTFLGHTEAILSLTISPDGLFVLTGSDDRTARIFLF